MDTQVNYPHKPVNALWLILKKISSWQARLIGPFVFNFGIKEPGWKMSTSDFLRFPSGTIGKTLGEFFKNNWIDPIAGAECHDLYHVIFDYSSTFKDEVALQFFLKGNGKNSIASFVTYLGAWVILPLHWSYLKSAYARGKKCNDISNLDLKSILFQDIEEVRATLFEEKGISKKEAIITSKKEVGACV